MAWISFWSGSPTGPSFEKAEAYVIGDPPGAARCSCGRLAQFIANSETGSNPAEHTFSLEAHCGDSSHLIHSQRYITYTDFRVARDGRWECPTLDERAAEYRRRHPLAIVTPLSPKRTTRRTDGVFVRLRRWLG